MDANSRVSSCKPLVSVLMPVYNAAAYVEEAIRSVLTQTYDDFELLVFDDGSTDGSIELIRAIEDTRIRLFESPQNLGYVVHLNEGLRLAQGVYIARMDADDIALPERFAKQVALLNSEPNVVLCGTSYEIFGSRSEVVIVSQTDRAIRAWMLFENALAHPTVMFRKSVIEEHKLRYGPEYMPAEDYKLWYDFSKIGQLRNLPEVLLKYRAHPNQISASQYKLQVQKATTIRLLQLTDKGFHLTEDEKKLYSLITGDSEYLLNTFDLRKIMILMQNLLRQNEQLKSYRLGELKDMLSIIWVRLYSNRGQYDWAMLMAMVQNNSINHVGLVFKIKLLLKVLSKWKPRR